MRHSLCRYAGVCLLLTADLTDGFPQGRTFRTIERQFQFSVFPGISTNGVASADYYNYYSLNLFGGLSGGNRNLEIGLFTNVNVKSSTGIQLAGFANIVGTNAFMNLTLSEERSLIHDGFECSITGIQFAGMLNYVRDHATGIQVSGGLNVVGRDYTGFQLAGVGNSAGGFTQGIQLAGLYNISDESMGGIQVSSLFNFVNGQFSGTQIGLMNKAAQMTGRRTMPPVPGRSLQIGLINVSKANHGMQIGIINVGGEMRGKQVGLINFLGTPSKENVRRGTPIGLLNLSTTGPLFRVYTNEVFLTSVEITTGNCLNCTYVFGSNMPIDDANKIFNQNALILGYDGLAKTWGFGYGFQKTLHNKFSVMPHRLNERRVLAYGLSFTHLNRSLSFDRAFNVVTRLHVHYGKQVSVGRVYAGVSINYFLADADPERYSVRSYRTTAGRALGMRAEVWPGYTFGLQL